MAPCNVSNLSDLTDVEMKVYNFLCVGEEADLAGGGKIDFDNSPEYWEKHTVSASFIQFLCSNDPNLTKNLNLSAHGLRIRGAKILGKLDLRFLLIPFLVSLRECNIPDCMDFSNATITCLDLSGSRTGMIEADGLKIIKDIKLSKGFLAKGPVCLKGATIEGDLQCSRGHFENHSYQLTSLPINGCENCHERMKQVYALVLERVTVNGSLYLCGNFKADGGVYLADATIKGNLNCTHGIFHSQKYPECDKQKKGEGHRLDCDTDYEYHRDSAFNGEGMRIEGNLILKCIKNVGEMRLTGAHIKGDLDSAGGTYCNKDFNAIHGDRLRVGGNLFFNDGFNAEGVVRLARAKVGADLSFYGAQISTCVNDTAGLYCEGIHVEGTAYLRKIKINNCFADLSNAYIGGNLVCTDGEFRNASGWALKGKGMTIEGSAFLDSKSKDSFIAEGLVCLTGSKLGMDLICTNGHFKSDRRIETEEQTPRAIMANSMVIGGNVEMNEDQFEADGGVTLNGTKIGGYLNCEHGKFRAQRDKWNHVSAIRAGKLQVGESIYLNEKFIAEGNVMLNDAEIGRNLVCSGGRITNKNAETLEALQMKLAGSLKMNNDFKSYGEVKIDRASIGGNLDCSHGTFVNIKEKDDTQQNYDGEDEKRFALSAVGAKIGGNALFTKGFYVDGIVSLQNADISRELSWKNTKNAKKVSLFLDSAKAGVLDDSPESWPEDNKLQINDFEYQFLKGLERPGDLSKRREIWLSLPYDFRTQPYEHLAAVLKRSGYEEDAKLVLIAKNNRLANRPIRWNSFLIIKLNREKMLSRNYYLQTQNPISFLSQKIFYIFVRYGYKPFQALKVSILLVLIGCLAFTFAFKMKFMVPVKEGQYVYQTANIIEDEKYEPGNHAINIANPEAARIFYSFIYSLDTFLPVVDFQVADYWLPTAYHPVQQKPPRAEFNWLGFVFCFYRWVLIAGGWIGTTLFLAALTGIVRR